MSERSWCTESWTESSWFQTLEPNERYLFIYLCTNNHCKQAGLYYITPHTITFETKIPQEDLPELLKALAPRVEWYPDRNLVWVRNFIKRQMKSPKFLIAITKCLNDLKDRDKDVIKELIQYNYDMHSISIPYGDGIDMMYIPSNTNTSTNNNTIREGEGVGLLIRQVWAGLGKRRNYKSPNSTKESSAIKWMLVNGFTPDQILGAYDKLKLDPFWVKIPHLDMQSVKKQIGAMVKGNGQKERPKQKRRTPITVIRGHEPLGPKT